MTDQSMNGLNDYQKRLIPLLNESLAISQLPNVLIQLVAQYTSSPILVNACSCRHLLWLTAALHRYYGETQNGWSHFKTSLIC
jgi:hypothetical protein